jgi:hypothetical protein
VIRRLQHTAEGSDRWILIMQPDHARLSGCCAEAWGRGPYARLEPHAELVSAIDRHDDGWATWERAPKVHPASCQPLDFTEMPLEDSLRIWRDSIGSAATVGYLAGYVVSGHFATLLRRFSGRWVQGSGDQRQLAEEFLGEQDRLQAEWLAAWQSQNPISNTHTAAQQALAYLQFFDTLSLWLCCAERAEPAIFIPPGGPELTLTPRDAQTIELSPWPFGIAELDLEVPGRSLPARRYADTAALAAVSWQAISVTWNLRPPR